MIYTESQLKHKGTKGPDNSQHTQKTLFHVMKIVRGSLTSALVRGYVPPVYCGGVSRVEAAVAAFLGRVERA